MYNYDNSPTSPTEGLLLSINAGNNHIETYSYDVFNRLASIQRNTAGKLYTTSYEYNGAGQRRKIVYPSGEELYAHYDNNGRLWKYGPYPEPGNGSSYLSQTLYNIAGQVTQMNLTNGITETFSYDAFGQGAFQGPAAFRFAGEYFDAETGFSYHRARYLDLASGRFITQDPLSGATAKPEPAPPRRASDRLTTAGPTTSTTPITASEYASMSSRVTAPPP